MIFNNEQPANTNIMDSSPDSLRLAADYYDKKKTSSNSNSKSTRQWEAKGQGLTCEENKTSTMMFNDEKPANTNIMYSSPDSLRLAAGYCDKKKTTYSESTMHWEPKGQGLAPDEKKMIQDASMFHKEKSVQNLEVEVWVSLSPSLCVSHCFHFSHFHYFNAKLCHVLQFRLNKRVY